MTNRLQQLSRRDLERLSAYLDGELSTQEAARLESRLQAEPILRGGLQELRQTKQMMAQLPQVRVPRSFNLSPEMVGQVERDWRYPVMQLATALAAFAFLVVVGFDAVASRGLSFGTDAPRLAAEAPAAQEAAPPEALMEIQEEDQMEQPAAEPQAEMRVATEGTESDSLGAAEAPAEEEALEYEAQGTPVPAEEASALDEAEVEQTEPPTATASATLEPAKTATPEQDQPPAQAEPPRPVPNWLRWFEIGLAALVIGLAGLTFRLRPR